MLNFGDLGVPAFVVFFRVSFAFNMDMLRFFTDIGLSPFGGVIITT